VNYKKTGWKYYQRSHSISLWSIVSFFVLIFIPLFRLLLSFDVLTTQLWPDPPDPPTLRRTPSLRLLPTTKGPIRRWRRSLRSSSPCSPPTALPSARRTRCPTGSPTPRITSSIRPSEQRSPIFRVFQKPWPINGPLLMKLVLHITHMTSNNVTNVCPHSQCVSSVPRSSVFRCCQHFVNGSPSCSAALFCRLPPRCILSRISVFPVTPRSGNWCYGDSYYLCTSAAP